MESSDKGSGCNTKYFLICTGCHITKYVLFKEVTMGGSSSGGGWSSGGPATNPCEDLRFLASINSPQPAALDDLDVGAVLTVQFGSDGQSVEVFDDDELVGALTGPRVASLLNCMHSGFEYQVTVVTIDGGQCQVQVEGK